MQVKKSFQYKKAYSYAEYKNMCEQLQDVKLPFMKGIKVNLVAADYIFSSSMKRIKTKKRNVFRRFLGIMFRYPVEIERKGNGRVAFVFSGDKIGRPDYLESVKCVVNQCNDWVFFSLNRQSPQFCAKNFVGVLLVPIYAVCLNCQVKNWSSSIDMAISIIRATQQGKYLEKLVLSRDCEKVVTYCDQWDIESVVAQLLRKHGIETATLQHGNGTEIFYGFCSDYYLANSLLSKENAISCGILPQKIIVTGPMKYAGCCYHYQRVHKIEKIGIVFDGANNFENNIEMLLIGRTVAQSIGAVCCIRYHPNNNRKQYEQYLGSTDIVFDDLQQFENSIDVCIVYNSTLYTDMIYKKKIVYRYKNGKVDLFSNLGDSGFKNQCELKECLQEMLLDFESCKKYQETLYRKVYGEEVGSNSYKLFFQEWVD